MGFMDSINRRRKEYRDKERKERLERQASYRSGSDSYVPADTSSCDTSSDSSSCSSDGGGGGD